MSAVKKNAPRKVTKEEYLVVNADEPWLHTKVSKVFFDDDFHRIIDYYVLHSPCKTSSYSPKSLESFGWRNPWQSSSFRKAFDGIPSFVEGSTFLWHESKNHFLELWDATGYGDFFLTDMKEFAVLIYSGESNPRMDLLHHIRNSFAHGRFSIKKAAREFYIYLEDVTEIRGIEGLCVVCRTCLKKSTLIAWIDLFEKKSDLAKTLSSLHV